MSDMTHDSSEGPLAESEVARWVRIENGVRQDAARLARLVLDGEAESYEAKLLARRIELGANRRHRRRVLTGRGCQTTDWIWPPSTAIVAPVTNDAAGEQRNTATRRDLVGLTHSPEGIDAARTREEGIEVGDPGGTRELDLTVRPDRAREQRVDSNMWRKLVGECLGETADRTANAVAQCQAADRLLDARRRDEEDRRRIRLTQRRQRRLDEMHGAHERELMRRLELVLVEVGEGPLAADRRR